MRWIVERAVHLVGAGIERESGHRSFVPPIAPPAVEPELVRDDLPAKIAVEVAEMDHAVGKAQALRSQFVVEVVRLELISDVLLGIATMKLVATRLADHVPDRSGLRDVGAVAEAAHIDFLGAREIGVGIRADLETVDHDEHTAVTVGVERTG